MINPEQTASADTASFSLDQVPRSTRNSEIAFAQDSSWALQRQRNITEFLSFREASLAQALQVRSSPNTLRVWIW